MPYSAPASGIALYTAEQTRQLDQRAIAQQQLAGFELMQRAARAALQALRQRWPDATRLTLLCGGGNNGGDALVLAALALKPDAGQSPLAVQLLLLGGEQTRQQLKGEALQALAWAEERGVEVLPYRAELPFTGEVLVDGLLGTGLRGELRPEFVEPIERINASGKPVLALDVPSGLCADTGTVQRCAVRADLTVSFIGLNRGLLTNRGGEHCGQVCFERLGVSDEVYARIPTATRVISTASLLSGLRPRPRHAHKGDFGHVLVVGGDLGMAGAAVMAATSALRSGAGLVSVATRPEHAGLSGANQPEVMTHGVRSGQALAPLLDRASVLVIGPGLGCSAWSGQLLREALSSSSRRLLVLDADALNLLCQGRLVQPDKRDHWVLTPHPGEAARLLGCSVAKIQADRFKAVNQLQQRYGGVVVLKGAGTLISDGQQIRLCSRGNPGMATAGMGDVLSGVIGALLAQGLGLFDAALIAVELHAAAADHLVQRMGERGLAATDLIPQIRRLLNPELFGPEWPGTLGASND